MARRGAWRRSTPAASARSSVEQADRWGTPPCLRRAADCRRTKGNPLGFGAMDFPEDLRYSTDHEWARVEDGRVRIGITDYAQDALGDVVYVEVPEVGTEVEANGKVSEVESTKSVSDIYAPVSGT